MSFFIMLDTECGQSYVGDNFMDRPLSPETSETIRALLVQLKIQNTKQQLKEPTVVVIENSIKLFADHSVQCGIISSVDIDSCNYQIKYEIKKCVPRIIVAMLKIYTTKPLYLLKKGSKIAGQIVNIDLDVNEIARMELDFQDTLGVIKINVKCATRIGFEGNGLSTSLFYLSDLVIHDLMIRLPAIFAGKEAIAVIEDVSLYKGESTCFSSVMARRLGFTQEGDTLFTKQIKMN